jgi:hypothetical protein
MRAARLQELEEMGTNLLLRQLKTPKSIRYLLYVAHLDRLVGWLSYYRFFLLNILFRHQKFNADLIAS